MPPEFLKMADLKALAKAVFQFAPTVATALGGPGAGIAVSLLEHLFGVSSDSLLSAISTNPDAALKLRGLENQHAEALLTIELKDRMDSRESAIKGGYDWFVHLLSVLVITGFFVCVFCLFLIPEKTRDHDILNMMLGVMGTSFVQVLSFYFGNIKR